MYVRDVVKNLPSRRTGGDITELQDALLSGLPLALLRLVQHRGERCRRDGRRGEEAWLGWGGHLFLLDRDAHMPPVAALPAVAFVLADALVRREAGVLAPPAGALPVAPLLALAATLAPGLRG